MPISVGGEKMLSKIVSVICIIAAVWSIFAGTAGETSAALLDGASAAVKVTLSLMGAMSFWSGVMAVLKEAGVIKLLTYVLRPFTRLIFNDPCEEAVACLAANFLGIGNAATPLGIDALKKMQNGSERITDDGIMLTALCTSSFSFIPTTVLALRRGADASVMFELLPVIWGIGAVGFAVSAILCRILCFIFGRRLR